MAKWLAYPVPGHGKSLATPLCGRYRGGQYFNNIEKFNIVLISPSVVCMSSVVIMLLKVNKQEEGKN